MTDLIKRFEEAAVVTSGQSLNNGCVDCGLDANMCSEAADLIQSQKEKMDKLKEVLGSNVPDEIFSHTFVVQYNPNCPSPWLVRLPGESLFIDLKPYSSLTAPSDRTGDILGFGITFEKAARTALKEGG